MPDDKIIDFQTAKEPHVHTRRDKKVDDMRQAFANYLDDGTEKSRQQRRKKQRDKDKKKKR